MAAAVLAHVVVAPAAGATAPQPPALTSDVTVSASRTGYVRVRLTRTLDLRRFNYLDSPPVFTGRGAVGVAFLPDHPGSDRRNVIIVRTRTDKGYELVESPAQGYDPVTGKAGEPRLLPGTYRLFYLTHGGGSVRLRLPGLPTGSRRLTAGKPVPWAFDEYRAPVGSDGYAPVSWDATLDFDGSRPGHVFGAMWLHSEVTGYVRGGACYFFGTSRSGRDRPLCMGGDGSGGAIARVGPETDRDDRFWHGGTYDEAPGERAVRLYYANAGRVTAAGATVLYLPGG